MSPDLESMLKPNFSRKYCDYFYFIMVFYVIIGLLAIVDTVLGAIAAKSMKEYMKKHLLGKILMLLGVAVQYFVIRLLYSMCHNSLPAESFEQFTGGDDEPESMTGGDDDEGFTEAGPEPFNGGDDGLEGMYGGQDNDDDKI